MEWDSDSSFILIEEYERHPVLWDPKHKFHFSKNRKQKAWEDIAEHLNVNVVDIKQKINSLLSSFRREKAKGEKTIETETGRRSVYVSKWFAFRKMQFLLNRNKSSQAVAESTEVEQDISEDRINYVLNIKNEEDHVYATVNEESSQDVDTNEPSSHIVKKRKINSLNEDKIKETIKVVKQFSSKAEHDCSKFTQYVASKMSAYDPRTRAIVEHMISNILFEADMGKFDVSCETTEERDYQSLDFV